MFFFFSSRRRHTRLQGDWSSDVCSSDLKFVARWSPPSNRPVSLERPNGAFSTSRRKEAGGSGSRRPSASAEAFLMPFANPTSWLRPPRSEEHTSELQSPCNLVCRLLLEKKKT